MPASRVSALMDQRLLVLGQALRLPGYSPGMIPRPVLMARYGARTRAAVLGWLGAEAAGYFLSRGGLPASLDLESGAESGDAVFRLTLTYLPDLPEPDPAAWEVERLTVPEDLLAETGMTAAEARLLLDAHVREQVLDHLHDAYAFPCRGQPHRT